MDVEGWAQLAVFLLVEGVVLWNVRRTAAQSAAALEARILQRLRDGSYDEPIGHAGLRLLKRGLGELIVTGAQRALQRKKDPP